MSTNNEPSVGEKIAKSLYRIQFAAKDLAIMGVLYGANLGIMAGEKVIKTLDKDLKHPILVGTLAQFVGVSVTIPSAIVGGVVSGVYAGAAATLGEGIAVIVPPLEKMKQRWDSRSTNNDAPTTSSPSNGMR